MAFVCKISCSATTGLSPLQEWPSCKLGWDISVDSCLETLFEVLDFDMDMEMGKDKILNMDMDTDMDKDMDTNMFFFCKPFQSLSVYITEK
jgi:hypothetical protein